MKKTNQLVRCFLSLFILLPLGCSTSPKENHSGPIGQIETFEDSPDRGIAAESAELNLSPLTYKLFEDYFSSSNQEQKFQFDLVVSTDKDKTYLKETTRKAIDDAFAKTFSDLVIKQSQNGESAGGMGVVLKGLTSNLPATMIDNYVKTLKVLKIVDTDVQFDLIFYPEVSSDNFDEEFSSNGYNNLNTVGTLSSKIIKEMGDTPWRKIKSSYERFKMKGRQEVGQFFGGVISIRLGVANVRLFKDEDRLLQGSITFRRYLSHDLEGKNIGARKGLYEVSSLQKSGMTLSTVDFVHTFTKKELKPKLTEVNFYPGQLISIPKMKEKPDHHEAISQVELQAKMSPFGKFDSVKVKISKLAFDPKTQLIASNSVLDPYDYKVTGEVDQMSYEGKISNEIMKNFASDFASWMDIGEVVRGQK